MRPYNFRDLTDQRFSRWTAKKYTGRGYWLCVCDCGTIKRVWGGNLTTGRTLSCGCFRDEEASKRSRTHGLTRSPEYKVWAGIKRRCQNTHDRSYQRYGAKGITVCKRWSDSFEAFLEDMGKRPSPEHSIDRIDNNKGYEPDNCRWSTKLEQMHNQTKNRYITFDGITKVLEEWGRITGIGRSTIKDRLNRGWSAEKALTTPPVKGRNQFSKD